MKITLSNRSWLYLGATLSFILLAALGLSNRTGLISTLSSLTHDEGDYYLDPTSAEIYQADSYTFTSYTQSSTDPVPTASTWTVERTDETGEVEENPTDIYLENCRESSSCTVHAGTIAGDLKVLAESDDQSAEATLTIKTGLSSSTSFTDTIPEWAKESVYMLRDRGIMKGYSDGSFGPGDSVNRAQFTVLLFRIMEMAYPEAADAIGDRTCDVFEDVPNTSYAYEAICAGYYFDWFEKITIGTNFSPDQELTRAEAAQLLANTILTSTFENVYTPLFEVDIKQLQFLVALMGFVDVDGRHENVDGIALSIFFDLIKGSEGNDGEMYFRPEKPINRAETAVIIARIIKDLDLQ